MGFQDLLAIHNPTVLTVPPVTWGDQIRDNFDWLANPPSVRVARSTVLSVPTSSDTAINFNLEDWDTNVIHDNVTNNTRLTGKTAGKYHIWAKASLAANATGDRRLTFYKNGVILSPGQPHKGTVAANTGIHISIEEPMAVNDFVELLVWQDSGGNLDLHIAGTRFGMTLISL